jgi:hypothetical protein
MRLGFSMNSLSTEAFPYTLGYVCELLSLDETKVTALCKTLEVLPYRDERTGSLYFNQQTLALLKKAADAEKKMSHQEQLPQTTQATAMMTATRNAYSSVPQRSGGTGLSRTDLSLIVDSVSNAKEGILRDLSQLLDDKLSGLDDVVVELIRSKSENDTLREELKRIEENQLHLQAELSKFKPAAFGFYRKES